MEGLSTTLLAWAYMPVYGMQVTHVLCYAAATWPSLSLRTTKRPEMMSRWGLCL